MLVRTEQTNLAVHATERFQAIEDGLGVVKYGSGWIQRKWSVGFDPRIDPTFTVVKVGEEHVVGKDLSEPERAFVRLCFEFRCLLYANGLCHRSFHRPIIAGGPTTQFERFRCDKIFSMSAVARLFV